MSLKGDTTGSLEAFEELMKALGCKFVRMNRDGTFPKKAKKTLKKKRDNK